MIWCVSYFRIIVDLGVLIIIIGYNLIVFLENQIFDVFFGDMIVWGFVMDGKVVYKLGENIVYNFLSVNVKIF